MDTALFEERVARRLAFGSGNAMRFWIREQTSGRWLTHFVDEAAFASLDPDSRVRDWAARVPEVRSRCGQQFGFDELTPGYGDATCGACAGVSDKAYSAA
jgi:hypothetical protein